MTAPAVVSRRMEIVLASERDASLVIGYDQPGDLRDGMVHWRFCYAQAWETITAAQFMLFLGVPLCEHYRLPGYDEGGAV
ncbi:MAG TPA: hypothetical protein VNW68_06565 [Candidatus Limnocylindria bacterium]|jgi:hypothetical protein|nr:hypothetical protein [Candidatus Limnocylindria bacterium]